jgi:pilus assembly protein CpaF
MYFFCNICKGFELIELDLFFEDGTHRHGRFEVPLLMGRTPECGIQVSHWRVARQHLRILRAEDGYHVDDLGSILGTRVNGKRITRYGPLKKSDEVIVGPCLLRLAAQAPPVELAEQTAPVTSEFSQNDATAKRVCSVGVGSTAEVYGEGVAAAKGVFSEGGLTELERLSAPSDPVPSVLELGVSAFKRRVVLKAATTTDVTGAGLDESSESVQKWGTQDHTLAQQELRQELRAGLIQAFDLRRNDVGALSDSALKAHALACVTELLAKRQLPLPAGQRDRLLKLVVDEAIGLGVIEELLEDAAVTEIMVNRFDEIFVEMHGRLTKHFLQFSGEDAVRSVIERIVYPLGRRIDEASPMVDARLPDGSRLNAVLPPVAVKGASFTIRKFPQKRLQMHDLVALNAVPAPLADFLRLCVDRRLNIVVSGGTGSGKTTLLNIMAGLVDPGQRIVTIEDSAELFIAHPHVVTLEARQANTEGRGVIAIRDLVKNALRMRPDRIVIGEVRGAEAIDMLAAMNTGHDGSITTLHANSPRDALSRLETMVLSGNAGLPLQAIREQINSAIQLIVQQTRLENGRRMITAVAEISGIESGTVQMQHLVRFDTRLQCLSGAGVRPAIFDDALVRPEPTLVKWFLQA